MMSQFGKIYLFIMLYFVKCNQGYMQKISYMYFIRKWNIVFLLCYDKKAKGVKRKNKLLEPLTADLISRQ